MKKYYCIPHLKETGNYTEAEGITDFPRGVFLAYGDCCLTTEMKTLKEAKDAIKKYPCKKYKIAE